MSFWFIIYCKRALTRIRLIPVWVMQRDVTAVGITREMKKSRERRAGERPRLPPLLARAVRAKISWGEKRANSSSERLRTVTNSVAPPLLVWTFINSDLIFFLFPVDLILVIRTSHESSLHCCHDKDIRLSVIMQWSIHLHSALLYVFIINERTRAARGTSLPSVIFALLVKRLPLHTVLYTSTYTTPHVRSVHQINLVPATVI